jgi:hypothetical protein
MSALSPKAFLHRLITAFVVAVVGAAGHRGRADPAGAGRG